MVEMKYCKDCDKLFAYIGLGPRICPACKEKEIQECQDIRDFVKENPNIGLKEVSEELGISVSKIQRYIQDGRLEVLVNVAGGPKCETCGKTISHGRFCSKCASKVANEMREAGLNLNNASSVRESYKNNKDVGLRYKHK